MATCKCFSCSTNRRFRHAKSTFDWRLAEKAYNDLWLAWATASTDYERLAGIMAGIFPDSVKDLKAALKNAKLKQKEKTE